MAYLRVVWDELLCEARQPVTGTETYSTEYAKFKRHWEFCHMGKELYTDNPETHNPETHNPETHIPETHILDYVFLEYVFYLRHHWLVRLANLRHLERSGMIDGDAFICVNKALWDNEKMGSYSITELGKYLTLDDIMESFNSY
ncbi:hypothetical protein OAV62_02175 [bacterium]|nr:hypothetical protein [bacterium]